MSSKTILEVRRCLQKSLLMFPVIQVNRPFDYHVPENLQESIEVGMRVAVPFGGEVFLDSY